MGYAFACGVHRRSFGVSFECLQRVQQLLPLRGKQASTHQILRVRHMASARLQQLQLVHD
jgi:hypothetical protein